MIFKRSKKLLAGATILAGLTGLFGGCSYPDIPKGYEDCATSECEFKGTVSDSYNNGFSKRFLVDCKEFYLQIGTHTGGWKKLSEGDFISLTGSLNGLSNDAKELFRKKNKPVYNLEYARPILIYDRR